MADMGPSYDEFSEVCRALCLVVQQTAPNSHWQVKRNALCTMFWILKASNPRNNPNRLLYEEPILNLLGLFTLADKRLIAEDAFSINMLRPGLLAHPYPCLYAFMSDLSSIRSFLASIRAWADENFDVQDC